MRECCGQLHDPYASLHSPRGVLQLPLWSLTSIPKEKQSRRWGGIFCLFSYSFFLYHFLMIESLLQGCLWLLRLFLGLCWPCTKTKETKALSRFLQESYWLKITGVRHKVNVNCDRQSLCSHGFVFQLIILCPSSVAGWCWRIWPLLLSTSPRNDLAAIQCGHVCYKNRTV